MKTPQYFAGIDVGSTATKVTVIDSASRPLGQGIVATGVSGKRAAETALTDALRESDLPRSALSFIAATGYGRELVSFADRRITEITCHARGAWAEVGKPLSLIDIGGQDTKVISVGDSGRVQRFVMNDRCAAGTGRFLEVMARALETDVEGMARLALSASREAKINNMCTVFAESEVISLLAQDVPHDEIAHGLLWSVAGRVAAMSRKVVTTGVVYLSGGVAHNDGIVAALADNLGREVLVLTPPQFNGSYGAALLAQDKAKMSGQ